MTTGPSGAPSSRGGSAGRTSARCDHDGAPARIEEGRGPLTVRQQRHVPRVEAGDVGDAVITGITDAITGAVDTVVGSVRDLINSIIDIWNTFDLGIPSGEFQFWGPGSFGIPNPLGGYIAETKWDAMKFTWAGSGDMVPDLPHLAKGGIVTDPTIALIGEAGPEAVVPLDQYGGGGATVNIHVNGDPAVIKAYLGTERTIAHADA